MDLVAIGTWDAVVRHVRTLAFGEGFSGLVGVAATILITHRLAPRDFGVVMLGAAIAGQSLVAVLNYRASVALGVAPALDVLVLGETWTRRNS